MDNNQKYQAVIGLEVHVEIATQTKIFCSCKRQYGAPPNTNICPVCMGLPGALPVLNKRVTELAIKAGIVTNCKINKLSNHDRKHYFYPDLPKGYQISQFDLPLCSNGYVEIDTPDGKKKISIERIHIEEDAGKLIHTGTQTLIDHNRCGVPLIEIVSKPDISNGEEAKEYLHKLRNLLIYAGVSGCAMNEGEMRCDVNISVKPVGQAENGVRREIKNLNSFQFVAQAINEEFYRQVSELEMGIRITEQTLGYDGKTGKIYIMREKESSADYRYLKEPDLAPVIIDDRIIKKLMDELPVMPDKRKEIYVDEYCLSEYDATTIVANKELSDYFDTTVSMTNYKKALANILLGEYSRLNGSGKFDCPIPPKSTAVLCDLVGNQTINSSNAKKLASMMWNDGVDPVETVDKLNMVQINDITTLEKLADTALQKSPKLIADYKNGKLKASKAIMGTAMSLSKGNANPVLLEEIIENKLLNL